MTGEDVTAVADEAVRRARVATGFLVVHVAALGYAGVTAARGDLVLARFDLAVTGLLCLVTSMRALRHGYQHGHRVGRRVAYLGLLLTTSFVGVAIAVALRPPPGVSRITAPDR
ncbi:MAG TPA: hypothetical protein VF519_18770 [Mycobacteriales bacterium]